MATVLFISRTDLVKNSIIDGNVDTDRFIQFIKVAQEIEIRNYLGTKLYDKIGSDISGSGLSGDYETLVKTYVQPMLIWYAQAEYIPYAAYQIKNGGVMKHISENAEGVSKNEVDYLVGKARDTAEYYTQRFLDYINNNSNLFPEYNQNTGGDVYPDSDALFNGWVL
ncbi:MAG: hypothetical protein GOVbin2950_40 [Prokaryotic dsDNA virus sp.]|nr:MAG: hypothetical protein GOVbin2950_40 [Prokaryotic dsDNA virus sp.]|tara:strand:+ start:1929 stop:2429 length:501 start_codon:yes stop_codon:yes gene_type:complete